MERLTIEAHGGGATGTAVRIEGAQGCVAGMAHGALVHVAGAVVVHVGHVGKLVLALPLTKVARYRPPDQAGNTAENNVGELGGQEAGAALEL